MPAFVQSCSPLLGDFAFGYAVATTPYLLIPPKSQNMIYQPTPSLTSSSSFFGEVSDTSPVSEDLVFGSSYIASPSQPTEPKIRGRNELPPNIQPTVVIDNKSNCRKRNRRQSKASSAISESRASGNTAELPRRQKRGRKPKEQTKSHERSGQLEELDDDDDDDNLPIDPRRRRILERNRIAATKCRLRKNNEASALASREEATRNRNQYLSACFDSLTAEIYYLKTELLKHTDCNCVLIQKYIAHEAKKSVDGLFTCSSAFHTYSVSLTPNHGSSNNASTAESMYSPEADGIPPTGMMPFQQGSRASEVREDVFGMSLEPLHTTPMPPDSIVSAHPLSSVPLVGCRPGLYDSMGRQEHQADEIGWDPYWSFDSCVTVVS